MTFSLPFEDASCAHCNPLRLHLLAVLSRVIALFVITHSLRIFVKFCLNVIHSRSSTVPLAMPTHGCGLLQVSSLAEALNKSPHNVRTAVLSIDDFYLPHDSQLRLAATHRDNPLVQHRGQPSTHDLLLVASVLSSLHARKQTKIPTYDKSAFEGQGDRLPEPDWLTVNGPEDETLQVVIIEGWCIGFRSLNDNKLRETWEYAFTKKDLGSYRGRLGHTRFEDVKFVNEALKAYDTITNRLNALIHLDAVDTQYVYEWRREQEAELRRSKNAGMTDQQVISFVNGYYPSYELYTEQLRNGVLDSKSNSQLRIVIGKDRKVKDVMLF